MRFCTVKLMAFLTLAAFFTACASAFADLAERPDAV